MRTKSFVNTSLNVTETRIDKGAWKKIVTQSVHLEEHCTKIEILFHLFYAPIFLTNLVFKFNTVLIFIFFFYFLIMSAAIYFFAFWLTFYISLSWRLSSASTLFIRNSQILMRLGLLFLKVFSLKMLCSYFFMKNAYLVTAKVTVDVKNCLHAA